ncbi:MAG: SDR family oxidoreductase [Bacteroidia bacterium]|nr:SDR family oxidoreductase [Bacteroidia bacterium]
MDNQSSPKQEKKSKISRRKLLIGLGIGTVGLAAIGGNMAINRLGLKMPEFIRGKEKVPDLTGKSVLITGSSSGFGRAGAEHYARLGAKVFASMRNLPRPEADELLNLARREKLDITVIEIDVTNDEQVKAGVAKALEQTKNIDVLINNAAIAVGGPIEAQDMEATQLMFDTNVFGPQRLCREVLPIMRANGGGHVFNVSSMLGRLVVPGYGQYSPTKFALEALSEQMSYEMQGTGVGMTIIQPGGYPTKIWQNQASLTAALKERMSEEMEQVYPKLTAPMGEVAGGANLKTDPMDVPRAIADVLARPPKDRPLRRAVHPVASPQMAINKVSAQQQDLIFSASGSDD